MLRLCIRLKILICQWRRMNNPAGTGYYFQDITKLNQRTAALGSVSYCWQRVFNNFYSEHSIKERADGVG